MTYGHSITNQGWIFIVSNMYDAIILNVCFITNSNVEYVASDNSSKPD